MKQVMDAHVHTSFSSFDCQCPMQRYIDRIDEGWTSGIGFSDHLHPLCEQEEKASTDWLDDAGYNAKLDEFIEKGYDIHKGVEVTYDSPHHDLILKRLHDQDYEYVIGSVHNVDGLWVSRDYYQSFLPGAIYSNMLERYYQENMAMLAVEEIDVIGHVGVYRRFLRPEDALSERYQGQITDLEHALAEQIAKSDKILELNTSSMGGPSGEPMASRQMLQAYFQAGGRNICLGSDAHDASVLCRKFEEAIALLKEIGFSHVVYPWAKESPEKI